jgi:hypothetical protein
VTWNESRTRAFRSKTVRLRKGSSYPSNIPNNPSSVRSYEQSPASVQFKRQDPKRNKHSKDAMLLSVVNKGHNTGHALQARTLANYILEFMAEIGIDTKQFKSHSVKAVGASTALDAGVDLAHVMLRAGWSQVPVVAKHYYRSQTDHGQTAIVLGAAARSLAKPSTPAVSARAWAISQSS